jgi:hypothetical protein
VSVRLNDRDMRTLEWIAEMYGAPMTLVALLLGSSLTNAYKVVCRWRAAGLVGKPIRPVPGPTWVYPNRETSTALLGFYTRSWLPTPKMANHTETVGRVRWALTGFEDRWISERQLIKDAGPTELGKLRGHVHDGIYLDDLGHRHAIEVELTRKGSRQARVVMADAVAAAREAECVSVIYYADPAALSRVRAASKDLRLKADDPEVKLRELAKLPDREPVQSPRPRGLNRGKAS